MKTIKPRKKKIDSSPSSEYHGVFKYETKNKIPVWRTKVFFHSTLIYVGQYETELKAALAHDAFIDKHVLGIEKNFPKRKFKNPDTYINDTYKLPKNLYAYKGGWVAKQKNTTSKYYGVWGYLRSDRKKKWIAGVAANRKTLGHRTFGTFESEMAAGKARDCARVLLGLTNGLNFPELLENYQLYPEQYLKEKYIKALKRAKKQTKNK